MNHVHKMYLSFSVANSPSVPEEALHEEIKFVLSLDLVVTLSELSPS